jgi:hypothetical protein
MHAFWQAFVARRRRLGENCDAAKKTTRGSNIPRVDELVSAFSDKP